MPHVFEPAPTGRAKCRGCGRAIAKDTLRFGERHPNPYGEGEATHWFHPPCAAHKRPEAFLEGLAASAGPPPDLEAWRPVAELGAAHPRLPRVDGASRAPTGRARCRHCKEMIPKDAWRIDLVFWEEGRFMPSGFAHVACAPEYFGTADLLDRIRFFSELGDEDAREIAAGLSAQ